MSLDLVDSRTPKKYIQEIASKITSLKDLKDVNAEKKLFEKRKKINTGTPTLSTVSRLNDTASKNSSLHVTPKESKKNLTPVSNRNNLKENNENKPETKGRAKLNNNNNKSHSPAIARSKSPGALRTSFNTGKENTSLSKPSTNKPFMKDKKNCVVAKYTNISRFLKKPDTTMTEETSKSQHHNTMNTVCNRTKKDDDKECSNNMSKYSENTQSLEIYQKKIIPKHTPRTGPVDKKVQSMLMRMEEFEQAKQKRLECIKTKKAQEFLSQFKNVPTINEKSKKLVKNDFYSRMEENKKESELKKRNLVERNNEKMKRLLTPEFEKRNKNNCISPIQYAKKQLKWEQERKMKIESLREIEKINELKDCPFKPELNPKSMQIVQIMEQNWDKSKSIASRLKRESMDDFNLRQNKKNKLNLDMSSEASEGEIQDSVKEVSVNTKKKKKLYNLNNYSTNKEELLIEKMFESKFSMLKLNE